MGLLSNFFGLGGASSATVTNLQNQNTQLITQVATQTTTINTQNQTISNLQAKVAAFIAQLTSQPSGLASSVILGSTPIPANNVVGLSGPVGQIDAKIASVLADLTALGY